MTELAFSRLGETLKKQNVPVRSKKYVFATCIVNPNIRHKKCKRNKNHTNSNAKYNFRYQLQGQYDTYRNLELLNSNKTLHYIILFWRLEVLKEMPADCIEYRKKGVGVGKSFIDCKAIFKYFLLHTLLILAKFGGQSNIV